MLVNISTISLLLLFLVMFVNFLLPEDEINAKMMYSVALDIIDLIYLFICMPYFLS